jgi:copper chaperone
MVGVETYRIVGLKTSDCVLALTTELLDIPGVTDVEVDLDAGTVRLDGADREQVREAVRAAGFDFARLRAL